MIIYGLKTCDTCRKARKALETAGHDVSFHDVREAPLSVEERQRFHAEFGEALINRRSTTWRALDEAARSRDPLTLLAEVPTVMKRPVIATEDRLYLGWGKDVQAALLG